MQVKRASLLIDILWTPMLICMLTEYIMHIYIFIPFILLLYKFLFMVIVSLLLLYNNKGERLKSH